MVDRQEGLVSTLICLPGTSVKLAGKTNSFWMRPLSTLRLSFQPPRFASLVLVPELSTVTQRTSSVISLISMSPLLLLSTRVFAVISPLRAQCVLCETGA